MKNSLAHIGGTALLASALFSSQAFACTEITGAVTISTSGTYCLNSDLTVGSGTAIMVGAHNVTIDLNGHTLTGTGTGVQVAYRDNLTVTNGTLQDFSTGVSSTYSDNLVVKNVVMKNAGKRGVTAKNGEGVSISDNDIFVMSSANDSYGIELDVIDGASIANNQISIAESSSAHDGRALQIKNTDSAVIENNHLTNASSGSAQFGSTGVYFDSTHAVFAGNTINDFETALDVDTSYGTEIVARDNTSVDPNASTTPIVPTTSNFVDAGGNFFR